MTTAQPVEIRLHKRQGQAFLSEATEIMYGGAAGGGKSHLLRSVACAIAYDVPGAQVYLIRRQSTDLIDNHMMGPTGFPAMLANLVMSGHCKITYSPKCVITFWHGAKIHLGHCKDEKDVYDYQGKEIHVLLMDELTHFTDTMYRFLRGRVRLGSLQVPEGSYWKGRLPRIIGATNPGNLGHAWVKQAFIDNTTPLQCREMPDEEGGMVRQFIPAMLADNPTLMKNDPKYAKRLMGLGTPELVRAMLEGDWDIVAGAALEKLSRLKHEVRPFRIPGHWTKFTSMDWGTAKPFSVGWYAVVEGDTLIKAKEEGERDVYLPDGALVRYREYYGWNGKADEGCRKESYEVAREILEIEQEADETMDYRIGDNSMWAQTDGPSPQERMYTATDGRFVMRPSEKDRTMNYQEVRARIAGEDDRPMLYITTNCHQFWRTVPSLQLDQTNPEKGPDTKQEDHAYDDLSYACRSRPYTTNAVDRITAAYRKAKRAVGQGGPKDPYRVKK